MSDKLIKHFSDLLQPPVPPRHLDDGRDAGSGPLEAAAVVKIPRRHRRQLWWQQKQKDSSSSGALVAKGDHVVGDVVDDIFASRFSALALDSQFSERSDAFNLKVIGDALLASHSDVALASSEPCGLHGFLVRNSAV